MPKPKGVDTFYTHTRAMRHETDYPCRIVSKGIDFDARRTDRVNQVPMEFSKECSRIVNDYVDSELHEQFASKVEEIVIDYQIDVTGWFEPSETDSVQLIIVNRHNGTKNTITIPRWRRIY